MKQEAPSGIFLLSYVYAVNVSLYLLSLALFDNRVLLWGKEASFWSSWFVRLLFVFIPVYLAFRLRELKKDAWFLAVFFHIYFVINNLTCFLESSDLGHALVRIVGFYGLLVYSPAQLFVILLNTLLNTIILWYLFYRRAYFLNAE